MKLLKDTSNRSRKIDWTDEATASFFKVKDLKALQARLYFLTDDNPIFLLTDASDYGIGAYLYQLIDNIERPIAFISKSLSGAQLKWSTIQTEANSIFYSVTNLQYLLRNRSFRLLTDHRNLTFVGDSVNAMVVRWKLALIQYDFDIEHIADVKNVVADLLSRLVENHMKDNPEKFYSTLIVSALTNGYILPDDAYANKWRTV